jgi:hypothetical protein
VCNIIDKNYDEFSLPPAWRAAGQLALFLMDFTQLTCRSVLGRFKGAKLIITARIYCGNDISRFLK